MFITPNMGYTFDIVIRLAKLSILLESMFPKKYLLVIESHIINGIVFYE